MTLVRSFFSHLYHVFIDILLCSLNTWSRKALNNLKIGQVQDNFRYFKGRRLRAHRFIHVGRSDSEPKFMDLYLTVIPPRSNGML
jgi:hypothetical protein